MKPLADRVFIRPIKQSEISPGGVYMPSPKHEKYIMGTVVAVGDGKKHPETGITLSPEVKVGDKVVFQEAEWTTIDIDGEELLVLREDCILCVKND